MANSGSDKLTGALQENILALLIFNDEHCRLIRDTIELRLWGNPIFREIAKQAYGFIDQHKAPPGEHIADLLEDHLKRKEDGRLYVDVLQALEHLRHNLNTRYVADRLHKFVRENTLKAGIIEAAQALQVDDIGKAESVIEKALRKQAPVVDSGLTLDAAIKQLESGEDERECISLRIPEFDRFEIGPARGELWLLVGGPKRGKTFGLLHVAKQAMVQRQRVMYITLEVSERIIARRMLQSIFGLTRKEGEWVTYTEFLPADRGDRFRGLSTYEMDRPGLKDIGKLKDVKLRLSKLRMGHRFRVKSFPTGTLILRELETFLDQTERLDGFVPDVLIVDYADLMAVDMEQYRLSVGNAYKGLRGLAVQRNMRVATASQLNRVGVNSRAANETNIAEDFSKVAIADTVIVINQTQVERKLGIARLYVAAHRNDADRFSVLISQNFAVGQFAFRSESLKQGYFAWLREQEQEESDQRAQSGDGDEEQEGKLNGQTPPGKKTVAHAERSDQGVFRELPEQRVRRSSIPEVRQGGRAVRSHRRL